MLQDNLNELNERKVIVMNELQSLRERIDNEGVKAVVDKLVLLKKSLKELEREENEVESVSNSELEDEIHDLEEQIENGSDRQSLSDRLSWLLSESEEKINSAKQELASRLRAVLAVQRKIDDIPCQSELVQYDHRLSELNAQIQGKLRQTRKYYATYNALLEIKEMMLKEASLLNSISSQFQDAITSTDGRMKLINSMEGIMKGSQQKLKKVEQGLQEEQKVCDSLKARHVAATAEQRRCYSLLKAFQEECAKNELLRKSSK
ncbi:PREDICTED: coiled-coil domain-containing protein 93 [Fragaria vesca subsp. vesca]|uniref:coiled-coil domain-containing protein 93 n=1 Tax=Fragaria vesca subsp. vesca TaxID=101020 RepID=UPI0002C31906|nr:PREDICTED: coiled-coil domain-containing protein 93 [Fragaria vesca subsp. vesca]